MSVNLKTNSGRISNKRNQNQEDLDQLAEVRRRVRALKKLQFKKLEIDGRLQKMLLELTASKFGKEYEEINAKRRAIITGEVEPQEEDCDFEFDSQESGSVEETKGKAVEGIPHFWLRAMNNFAFIRDFIFPKDVPILKHLRDIVVTIDGTKLILEFHFGPNEYFNNKVLTKEYNVAFGPDPSDPWAPTTFHPISRKGCEIGWKDGKSVIKNNKKSKRDVIQIKSFFQFFEPPIQHKDEVEVSEDIKDYLWDDWLLAQTLVEKLVPNAVLCYTGHMAEEEPESESDSDDEESVSDESDSN